MARRRGRSRRESGFGAAGTVFLLFLLLLIAAGAAAAWAVLTPYGPSQETFVEVLPGSSSTHIARQLQQAGVIRTQYAFYAMRWVKHGTLKAGTYRFDHPEPVTDVYDRIRRGDTYAIEVTIPEGSNIFDIGARLQQAGFGPKEQFVSVASNRPG